MTSAVTTMRHCPRPQTIPMQAASQVQAALVSPRTLKWRSRVDDDAGAEKADPGQDALHDPAARRPRRFWRRRNATIASSMAVASADQRQRLQADRLAVQVAVETDQAAGQRGDAKTQYDFGPVQQSRQYLRARACFGSRPIM